MRLEKLTGVEEPVRLGTGFASPFQPRQEERAVTEQYHETMDRIDDIISDDSVATSYKKELIHLIQAALSTILNLIEEK